MTTHTQLDSGAAAHSQFRLIGPAGWTEYATSADILAALASEAEKYRTIAPLDEPIEDGVNDYGDEDYDSPPVIPPTVEQWAIDEAGHGEWRAIDISDVL
jgi:hypothetical protein